MSNSDSSKKITYSVKSQLQIIAAGATSAALTRIICQPLEVLQIRFQLQIEPLKETKHSKYSSLSQACCTIFQEEGIKAFWRGHNAGQLLSFVYGICQFWAYEQICLDLSQRDLFRNRPNWNRFVSGGLAGSLATMTSMPFDVIRTRLVSQDSRTGYRSATRAIPHIFRNEGFHAFYHGLLPALLQMAPLIGTSFTLYEMFNDLGMDMFDVVKKRELPAWYLLLAGGTSGIISKVLTYPLDLLKRRLQIQGFQQHRQTYGKNMVCNGTWDCLRLTIRDEGILGLYKGIWPTLIRSGVTTALYFGIYDTAKMLIIAVTGD